MGCLVLLLAVFVQFIIALALQYVLITMFGISYSLVSLFVLVWLVFLVTSLISRILRG